jgi:hypothetical protein
VSCGLVIGDQHASVNSGLLAQLKTLEYFTCGRYKRGGRGHPIRDAKSRSVKLSHHLSRRRHIAGFFFAWGRNEAADLPLDARPYIRIMACTAFWGFLFGLKNLGFGWAGELFFEN